MRARGWSRDHGGEHGVWKEVDRAQRPRAISALVMELLEGRGNAGAGQWASGARTGGAGPRAARKRGERGTGELGPGKEMALTCGSGRSVAGREGRAGDAGAARARWQVGRVRRWR